MYESQEVSMYVCMYGSTQNSLFGAVNVENRPLVTDEPVEIDAPITPNFPSGSSREIVGDYVEK